MTDDEIRTALLDARGGFAPLTVRDHVVVGRHRVKADDLDEVDRWVRRNGGDIRTQPGYESQSLGAGRWHRGPSTEPSDWYVIPAAALGLDKRSPRRSPIA
jgi:hypothetical protein